MVYAGEVRPEDYEHLPEHERRRLQALRHVFTRLLELLPPADDGELVDRKWADGIGWECGYGMYWPSGDRVILLAVGHDKPPVLSWSGRVITDRATRGHVRRLCAALGMQLKETTA